MVLDKPLAENSRYINLGDWFSKPHYAVWDGEQLTLKGIEE
jgi:hypothetical protein